MQENEILSLIGKYLAGTATSLEKKRILNWYRSYNKGEIEIPFNDKKEKDEIRYRLFQKLQAHIIETRTGEIEPLIKRTYGKSRMIRWAAAAAVIMLIFVGYWLFKPFGNSKNANIEISENNTVITKPGSKTHVILPDGSKVWVNAGSKIVYDKYFNKSNREIFLIGEAFFDVVKDKTRPFIVHTNDIDLKVLGTAFNVRAYENEKETVTALVHGSIEVTVKNNPGKKILLKPTERLVVKNHMNGAIQTKKEEEKVIADEPAIAIGKMHYYGKDSSDFETSWVKNRLAFRKERLDEIALRIELWFNVSVIITDASLKDSKYNGVFEDETLEEVMEALKLTGNFKYTIKEGKVIITR